MGCEDGSLRVLDARSSTPAQTVQRAHGSRVRGVAAVPAGGGEEAGEGNAAAWLAGSASSDGTVRLWDLRSSGGVCARLLCAAGCGVTTLRMRHAAGRMLESHMTSVVTIHHHIASSVQLRLCTPLLRPLGSSEFSCRFVEFSKGVSPLKQCMPAADAASSSQAQPLCEASTSARLTCLCAMSPPNSRSSKRGAAPPKPVKKQAQAVASDESVAKRAALAADRRKREEAAAVEAAKRAAELAEKRAQEREKRERKRAAAAAQHQGEEEARKGVVVKRKAETVVEFPDEPQRPKKAAAQNKKKKKKKGPKQKQDNPAFEL